MRYLYTTTRSRFTQLLFPEELEETDRNDQLRPQCNPEPVVPTQRRSKPSGKIREHVTRPVLVWCSRLGQHRDHRTQDLCDDQGHCNVYPRQSLQKHHAESNALE